MLFEKIINGLKKEAEKITIREILKGTTVGRMQSVGYLQVIPLLSDLQDERFASPNDVVVGTSDYGSMVFDNPTDQLFIVPVQAGYVVKQKAQDHAMAHTGLVPKKQTKTYKTAMCIQQSQGGHISKGKHKLLILPFSLRETALLKRKEKGYNKLWEAISTFNANLGASKHGHLEYFLKKFKAELNEFVAEFEAVPNQVGAIVLLDGQVVGIERTPSTSYWNAVWPALIRECYGSLAIEYKQSLGGKPSLPKDRVYLPESVGSLPELKKALQDAETEMEELAKAKVRELLEDPFKRVQEEKISSLEIETLEHEQFLGQIIHEEQQILYASMIVSKKWFRQKDWLESKAFSI